MGRAPLKINVIPGRADRVEAPYGKIVSSRFYAPRPFVQPRRPGGADLRDYDYGIIILPRPFQELKRFMRLQALDDQRLREIKHHRLITIAGYPGDRPLGTQWRHAERLRKFTPTRLLYTVDTCPGHSGSPVFTTLSPGSAESIIGIHTSGIVDERGRPYGCSRGTILAPPGMMNSGVRVTRDVMSNAAGMGEGTVGRQLMIRLP
jgi:V8-like Glu-specific endopeptidase